MPSAMPSSDPGRIPDLPDLDAIRRAAERIAPHAHETPVFTCRTLDRMCGARLFFKAESLQRAGAFKFRGAANAVLSLSDEEAARGVLTHSSGNHGAALALAAAVRGIPARVVMPEDAPRVKQAAVAGYGAECTFCEPTHEARRETAERLAEETGAMVVHPYDDVRVIAGQGTAALEIHRQVPDLDYLVLPVGGGGLASGCAIATAGVSPRTRVVGAEPARADDAARSLAAGRHLTNPPGPVDTVADGLKASLAPRTYRALAEHLERVVTVPEEDVLPALRLVWERMKLVIEPSCAVPVAALLAGTAVPHLSDAPGDSPGDAAGDRPRVGVILSGGNVDLEALDWSSVAAWPEAAPGGPAG